MTATRTATRTRTLTWWHLEPTAILYVLNTAVALAVAWGFTLSTDQQGAIATIATAVITVLNALAVRPVSLPLIKGAAATALVAFSAFGLNLSADQIGYSTAALSIIIGLLIGQRVTPVSLARRGTTAEAVYRERTYGR